MDIEYVKNKVQMNLSKKRYAHTLRVMEVAVELAHLYGASIEKVQYSALLHDYLKEQTPEELTKIIQRSGQYVDVLEHHHALWHGPAAAILIQEQFQITDESIIQAVRNHTTGRPQMDLVEQIVFMADYIEPARSFPGIEDIRKTAYTHIEEAIPMALGKTIIHLINQGVSIYPNTMFAYNAYIMK